MQHSHKIWPIPFLVLLGDVLFLHTSFFWHRMNFIQFVDVYIFNVAHCHGGHVVVSCSWSSHAGCIWIRHWSLEYRLYVRWDVEQKSVILRTVWNNATSKNIQVCPIRRNNEISRSIQFSSFSFIYQTRSTTAYKSNKGGDLMNLYSAPCTTCMYVINRMYGKLALNWSCLLTESKFQRVNNFLYIAMNLP